nr:U-box domain-containing protein 5 [Ipomoea batatas]GMC58943.1 U-box domain-containing protein 5 [Ipomoea batatas]GME01112.1 U-box domain-containing protein 5 [Ipomoea batatas]
MCTELINSVSRASKILPAIEASRPRCRSGIEALCLLNKAIEKAKSILKQCSESSKLYLALKGDVILLRCQKSWSLLEVSLSQIQNMVPVLLAAEVAQLVDDLRGARFSLEPSEEEAAKVVKELLFQCAKSELESVQVAMWRLNITSPNALLMEKRCIKTLLDNVGEGDGQKKKILLFLLDLLSKYGKAILEQNTENGYNNLQRDLFPAPDIARANVLNIPIPPDAAFKCPISSRVMYDPVVIASGETYERMWIQRWFDAGHNTCPKTGETLPDLTITPNKLLKGLISKWCAEQGVACSDPTSIYDAVPHSWEASSASIASLNSYMDGLSLPIAFTNLSIVTEDHI